MTYFKGEQKGEQKKMEKCTKNSIVEKIIYSVCALILIFMNSLLTSYWIELIWRKDVVVTWQWIGMNGENFICTVWLLFLLSLAVYLISHKTWIASLIVDVIILFFGWANDLKFQAKGEVVIYSDLTLIGEGFSVLDEYDMQINGFLIVALVFMIMRLVLFFFLDKQMQVKRPITLRVVGVVAGIVVCVFIMPIGNALYEKWGVVDQLYVPYNYYADYGMLPGFFRTIPKEIEEPEQYNQKVIDEIMDEAGSKPDDDLCPNVIFVMEESLYDVASLQGVQLSEDPLKNFKKLQEKYASGIMLSPTFGGSTSQVEFEVLTGYPSSNVPGMAYTDYISGEIECLTSLYKERGYVTYAMHPNTKLFFNRNVIYDYMGFDYSIFSDEMEKKLNKCGSGWVDDASFFENIIYEYENRDPSKPFFAYCITTQNHGGYEWECEKHLVDVLKAPSDAQNNVLSLETYANLAKQSDIEILKLIEYFENQDEPVIVVVFGDHSPNLGFFGTDINGEAQKDMTKWFDYHATPVLVYNNYDLEVDESELEHISAYRLGAYVAKLSGIHSDPYINLLCEEDCPDTKEGYGFLGDDTWVLSESYTELETQYLDDIWMIEYDRLFGENYYKSLEK